MVAPAVHAQMSVTQDFLVTQTYARRIVLFQEGTGWDYIKNYCERWRFAGVNIVMKLSMINGLVLSVPEYITNADLAADPLVMSIEYDSKIYQAGAQKSDNASFIRRVDTPLKSYYSWGDLRVFDQYFSPLLNEYMLYPTLVPAPIKYAQAYLKSRGIRIATLDTGAAVGHANIKNVLSSGTNMVAKTTEANVSLTDDDNGHGTHVAGVITSVLNKKFMWGYGDKGYIGLCPIKVLDESATGDLSNVIMAVQWALVHNIHILNMSIGYRYDSPALRRTFEEAGKAGLIMIASAGNRSNYDQNFILKGLADGGSADGGSADGGSADGGSADGGSADGGSASPSSTPLPNYSVMYPARYPSVIAVGASDSYGRLASFSNTGPELAIMAPGSNIVSADITNGNKTSGYGYCSGTSMAAPYVTAAAALVLAVNPDLDSQTVRKLIVENADHRATGPVGELNLNYVLTAIKNLTATNDPSIAAAKAAKAAEDLYRLQLKQKFNASGGAF